MYLVLGRRTGEKVFIDDVTLTVNQITTNSTTLSFTKGNESFQLTRKLGAKIPLRDNVNIIVSDINKGQLKLAFEAPRDVIILREELKAKQDHLARLA